MNLLLFRESEICDGEVTLSDYRAEHIIKVIKPKIGNTLKAGVLNGMVGNAEVVSVETNTVRLRFEAECRPPAAPELSLVLALPRPKVFRRILSGAVTMGIKDIHVINCWRVEKSYWSSPYISADNIEKYCFDALMQAKDTVMPQVRFYRFFMDFINEGLADIPPDRARFIAHPYSDADKSPELPAVVAVGPEGGFIERELQSFSEAGFTGFSLGERTLTTEHFVPFVLGAVLG